jgi:hypothetical protein
MSCILLYLIGTHDTDRVLLLVRTRERSGVDRKAKNKVKPKCRNPILRRHTEGVRTRLDDKAMQFTNEEKKRMSEWLAKREPKLKGGKPYGR